MTRPASEAVEGPDSPTDQRDRSIVAAMLCRKWIKEQFPKPSKEQLKIVEEQRKIHEKRMKLEQE
ncbi:hypothetical protein I79_005044 [Cricetulus griseus]|uniref:Uncharacterized protein n=1 Tax=Cricetulus griseus TaxID=10029 RepID=G3H449_CRIGR|nr:hypothetical protein I79_005044 [Cricetulus griseus]